MSWRTVVISSRCKLDCKMGFMVVRGEETKKVFLDDIAVVIIENPAVALTGCLLEALAEKKIRVIFCDSKRNPQSELVPYYGCYDSTRKIKAQTEWGDSVKGAVWAEIVSEKIRKQAEFLLELNCTKEAALLGSYLPQVEFHDATNREAHAAKVYFNALFGMDFSRSEENVTNAALNYGYGIVLSAFNREIVSEGYLTQLGIFHDNMFNHYNLSCDLMEPFRIIVDRAVKRYDFQSFSSEEKHLMVDILNNKVTIKRTEQTVLNAIKIYCRSIFEAMNSSDISAISFYGVTE